MKLEERAVKAGLNLNEAKYRTELSSNLKIKVKAFLKRFYPEYSSELVEMEDESYFHSLFVHVRCRREMADLELADIDRFYGRMAHEMFNLGAQVIWRIYEETDYFDSGCEEIKDFALESLKVMVLGESYYMIDHINSSKTDEAFLNLYEIMKMEPYSVPADEDELLDFSKIWFDAGTTVMWKHILENDDDDDESEKERFSILDFLSDILLFFS